MEDKITIRSRYDGLGGSHYDMRYTEEQIAKYELILSELPEVDLVLDNGCGTGLLFPFMKSSVVGLDLSGELLRKARERAMGEVYLVNCDSENLPFRKSVFDAVVSVTVIQNLAEPKKMASESTRVSRPGSRVIISSHKRVYESSDMLVRLVENEGLRLDRVFTDNKVNDWVTISTRIP